jgi:hypothetical protein
MSFEVPALVIIKHLYLCCRNQLLLAGNETDTRAAEEWMRRPQGHCPGEPRIRFQSPAVAAAVVLLTSLRGCLAAGRRGFAAEAVLAEGCATRVPAAAVCAPLPAFKGKP